MFKIIKDKYTFEIEKELNKLSERWRPVDVQTITYNPTSQEYIAVVKVGEELLPYTYYNPLLDIEGYPQQIINERDENDN